LPPQRGSSRVENSSTNFLTDMQVSQLQGDSLNRTRFHAVNYPAKFHA
jgi:hypothetical protein